MLSYYLNYWGLLNKLLYMGVKNITKPSVIYKNREWFHTSQWTKIKHTRGSFDVQPDTYWLFKLWQTSPGILTTWFQSSDGQLPASPAVMWHFGCLMTNLHLWLFVASWDHMTTFYRCFAQNWHLLSVFLKPGQ